MNDLVVKQISVVRVSIKSVLRLWKWLVNAMYECQMKYNIFQAFTKSRTCKSSSRTINTCKLKCFAIRSTISNKLIT